MAATLVAVRIGPDLVYTHSEGRVSRTERRILGGTPCAFTGANAVPRRRTSFVVRYRAALTDTLRSKEGADVATRVFGPRPRCLAPPQLIDVYAGRLSRDTPTWRRRALAVILNTSKRINTRGEFGAELRTMRLNPDILRAHQHIIITAAVAHQRATGIPWRHEAPILRTREDKRQQYTDHEGTQAHQSPLCTSSMGPRCGTTITSALSRSQPPSNTDKSYSPTSKCSAERVPP